MHVHTLMVDATKHMYRKVATKPNKVVFAHVYTNMACSYQFMGDRVLKKRGKASFGVALCVRFVFFRC
jgi:hypothetical protein